MFSPSSPPNINTMITINMLSLPIQFPSLCIPRVFQNITRERISSIIDQLEIGEIESIDMVPKTSENGDKFQRVFIHFHHWYSTSEALKAREQVLIGNEIKIVYQDPWFWKVSANHFNYNSNIYFPKKQNVNSNYSLSRPFLQIIENENCNNDILLKKKRFEENTDDNGFIMPCKYSKKIYKKKIFDKVEEKKTMNQFLQKFIPFSPPNSPPRKCDPDDEPSEECDYIS